MAFMPIASAHPSDQESVSHPHGPATGTSPAHGSPASLPWHREFTRRFEQALQSVNPNVTIPYWDWTDPKAIDVIFQPEFLGTNGEGTINIPGVGTVSGGPVGGNFSAASGWTVNNDLNLDFSNNPRGTDFTRFMQVPPMNNYPIPKEQMNLVQGLNDYSSYYQALTGILKLDKENGIPGLLMHTYIHALVGGVTLKPENKILPFYGLGTMSFLSAPYDPVFWLHHSNVDRLWAEWQNNGHAGSAFYPSTGQLFGYNLNDPMWPWDGGLSTPMNIGPGDLLSYLPHFAKNDVTTVADVLNISKLGYTYDTIPTSVPKLALGSMLGLFGLFSVGAFGAASLLKCK
jgi:tyrosinase